MVCQNQSIDDSDADLARDLRILVRERLDAGDSDEQVMDYVVSRYGEFVLLKPRFKLRNALLWGTPVLLLVVGGIVPVRAARRRDAAAAPLTADEEEALGRRWARTGPKSAASADDDATASTSASQPEWGPDRASPSPRRRFRAGLPLPVGRSGCRPRYRFNVGGERSIAEAPQACARTTSVRARETATLPKFHVPEMAP